MRPRPPLHRRLRLLGLSASLVTLWACGSDPSLIAPPTADIQLPTGDASGGSDPVALPCLTDSDCVSLRVDAPACRVARCAAGLCALDAAPDGEACDASGECGGEGVCKAGQCQALGDGGCDDGDPCTDDRCDADTGTCVADPSPTRSVCDPGDPCVLDARCTDDGACLGDPKCADGDLCTVDTCDPATGDCAFPPVPIADCPDPGLCADPICEPSSGGCGLAPVADGTPCDDDDPCTAGDVCAEAACTGSPVPCDDGDACTDDSCDPAAGGCVHTPQPAEDCADGNACTLDSCDPATGACVNAPPADGSGFGAPCDDGDPCTSGEACAIDGSCTGGVSIDCDDGQACTLDQCLAGSGTCANLPSLGLPGCACKDLFEQAPELQDCFGDADCAPCDTGDPCTGEWECVAGLCQPEAPIVCDDGGECLLGSCSPLTGLCTYSVDPEACDDGDACTVDSCDLQTQTCAFSAEAAEGSPCDDGEACTTDDACAAGVCAGDLQCGAFVCVGHPECPAETACAGGVDDDGDGQTDCEDPDCWGLSGCSVPEIDCADGVDDDGDGQTDCGDDDCADVPACQPEAPGPGDLMMTEVMGNPASPVGDATGEWIEVFNPGTSPRALDEVALAYTSWEPGDPEPAEATKVFTFTGQDLVVPPKGFVLLARSDNSTLNGDLPAVLATQTVALANSKSIRLRLLAPDWTGGFPPSALHVVDEIFLTTPAFGTSNQGQSWQLASFDVSSPPEPAYNAGTINWCQTPDISANAYATSNFGTPGGANLGCD